MLSNDYLGVLVIGGAAVAYLAVRAITNKKPGTAGTVVFGLLALLLGFALFGVFAAPVLHEVKTQSVSTVGGGTYTVVQHGQGRLALITWPVIVAVVVGGLWVVSRMRQSSLRGEGHGGWGLPLLVLVALVLVGLNVRWVRQRQSLEQQRQAAVDAVQQQVQAIQDGADALAAGSQQSVNQIWEQMNQPRIKLIPNPPPQPTTPSPPTSSSTPREVSPETDRLLVDMTKRIDALARQLAVRRDTDKMLADMATRIDVLARQSAVIAERLSEAKAATRDSAPLQTVAAETATMASAEMPTDGQSAGGSPSARPQPPAVDSSAAATGVVADAADAAVKLTTSATEAATSDAAAATFAEPRPAWVDDSPRYVANVWREVIIAGEYATTEECERAADIYLLLTTYDHIMRLTGNSQMSSQTRPSLLFQQGNVLDGDQYLYVAGRPVDDRLTSLARAGIGIDYIDREIARRNEDQYYVETVQLSFGPMKRLYRLAEFSPSIDRELRQRWAASQREERFAVVGVIAGSVLGLVGAVYGLLKVDTWTKGYYTKRLFLGVPAVIIGLVALLALMGV
jgi:hypothetical protein